MTTASSLPSHEPAPAGMGAVSPSARASESRAAASRAAAGSATAGSAMAGFVNRDDGGMAHLDLMVDGVKCAKCIRDIEGGLAARLPLATVRLNFSTKRLHVAWSGDDGLADRIIDTLGAMGFEAKPLDAQTMRERDEYGRHLLSCLAVAGFASANVMLLSVSVWAGSDMTQATRDLMHAISGLIALPAVAFAGRPFFNSALGAIRGGRINMDVPISLAVILASILSIVKTAQSGDHAYFDASVMLLFFLLIGRYLDHAMRAQARSAAADLLALRARTAQLVGANGTVSVLPVASVRPGDLLHVASGERNPVDGVLESGTGQFDVSLLTGESAPVHPAPGDPVFGGALNLGSAVQVRATKTAEGSLLSEIVTLMETAEQGRARYRRLADRAAGLYVPLVHFLAAATFLGWGLLSGLWGAAAENAIAILIITCPCALALAVPVVQVIASSHLFRRGILVKAADGLERLAEVTAVAFDKTGTLTTADLHLANREEIDGADLALAASLARASRHPLSRALSAAAGPGPVLETIHEVSGFGLEAQTEEGTVRLGRGSWCGAPEEDGSGGTMADPDHRGPVLWLRRADGRCVSFLFQDQIREDAAGTIAILKKAGLKISLLSGDRADVAEQVGRAVGIDERHGDLLPQDKIARLDAQSGAGEKVVMVGDGLNDAPALAKAHASISPAGAADITQTAADFVFQGEALRPVLTAWRVAKASRLLVLQNFGLAALYNMIAIPLAVSGFVTPLIAAIAMSASSIIVTLNALRLGMIAEGGPAAPQGSPTGRHG